MAEVSRAELEQDDRRRTRRGVTERNPDAKRRHRVPRWGGPGKRLGAVAAVIALSLPALSARATTLDVSVTGVRSAMGFVRVAVCSRATFLTDNCEYFGDATAVAGKTVLTVPNVTPGTYAVQVFHDDTGHGVIHQGLFGIPREGIGFSNDARLHLRGPKFDEASVIIANATTHVGMRLRYLRPFHPTEANLARR